MPKFIGVKDNKIVAISDRKIQINDLEIIELGKELEKISAEDLLLNYKIKDGKIIEKNLKKPIGEMKIAFISNYKMHCGIAEYFSLLCEHIIPRVKDYRLFIEKNDFTEPLDVMGETKLDIEKIIPCWKRSSGDLSELIRNIKEFEPDLIYYQHEFGLWGSATKWISMMTQLSEYRIIVTMHSTFSHKDKTICEAPLKEIVVHTEGAKKILKEEKKISANIHIVNHGCAISKDNTKLWNFYRTNKTIMASGFGFKYKSFETVIKALAIIKQKYNDVFLTILFSESPLAKIEHNLYYNELITLAHKLNVENNLGIIRGFQSDEVLDAYLRTNTVAVFPYYSDPSHQVQGSSGAARTALGKNIVVITSNMPHFEGLPTLRAENEQEIADQLDKIFSNPELVKKQLAIQNEYVQQNSWKNVAEQYIKIFEN